MQLSSKDPDIQTILNWIADKRIDLEPDFQRGEVWNTQKKQLLIDTILRGWQMPPIFIIIDEHSLLKNVLDGHQRLTTILQFWRNEFPVNGHLHPHSPNIKQLDGLYFRSLPERQRRTFLDFSIRIFEITNHLRDEPFELFYRLNEGVKLTAAERRNTFYGALKAQVKELVDFWEDIDLNAETLGFANSRLAYHDVIARLLIHLEKSDLSRKLTDKEITERYRDEKGVSDFIIQSVRSISVGLVHALQSASLSKHQNRYKRFSKPTLFSLLYFLSELHLRENFLIEEEPITKLLDLLFSLNLDHSQGNYSEARSAPEKFLHEIFEYYRYRSSTSVNDARALIIRDYFLNYAWTYLELDQEKQRRQKIILIANSYLVQHGGEDLLFIKLQNYRWGVNEER